MDNPNAPRDEYDCLTGSLLTRLHSSASEADIANYLNDEIVSPFRVVRHKLGWNGLAVPA